MQQKRFDMTYTAADSLNDVPRWYRRLHSSAVAWVTDNGPNELQDDGFFRSNLVTAADLDYDGPVIARLLVVAMCHAFHVASGQQPAVQASPTLWAGLDACSHRVGYRTVKTSADGTVHAWYPATASGTRLRFIDYAGKSAPQLGAFLERVGLNRLTIDSLFAAPLFASANPQPATGPFPLVLVAQGNGQDVIDQVILCEYLASLGFVVASTPSPMLRVPQEREDQVGQLADLQASDLQDAMAIVSRSLPIDRDRVGIVGHSFGARAALLLAMRLPQVRAVVSLDGGIGTATAVEHFKRAPSFRADAVLPPLLHFYEELDEFMKPDFTLLRSLRFAELDTVRTTDLRHTHFTTYGFLAAAFPDIARATRATGSTSAGLVTVAQRTGDLLLRLLR